MIRSGVGLIVERRFVERDVGRTTMTETDCLLVWIIKTQSLPINITSYWNISHSTVSEAPDTPHYVWQPPPRTSAPTSSSSQCIRWGRREGKWRWRRWRGRVRGRAYPWWGRAGQCSPSPERRSTSSSCDIPGILSLPLSWLPSLSTWQQRFLHVKLPVRENIPRLRVWSDTSQPEPKCICC